MLRVLGLWQKLESAAVIGPEETEVSPVGGDDNMDAKALGDRDHGSINKAHVRVRILLKDLVGPLQVRQGPAISGQSLP